MIAQPFSLFCYARLCRTSTSLLLLRGTGVDGFGPDRVGRALNEGLQLRDVLFLQLAGEVRHALVAERSLEDEVLQVDDVSLET